MASRIQQDTFMDDSDDTCPLCVEEFDLSDKNFRPCPCGYQICQFCYNNIKTTMNGLCPACRRTYDEKTIEWKVVSPEEVKADIALQAKKKALARQKETERKQVETLSRKHLAGLRVMQKNLVYVVGLNPKSREEDLLQTLRGDQYFGQYGKIIKIVVSKAKEGVNGSNSQGIYVTFEREEDAESCINAVNGSQNGDRVLRAQFGTTKYCSAYLRNETCNNHSCMFLHDSGEEYNNVSRQDASKMNAKAFAARGPGLSSSSPGPSQPPPQTQPLSQQDSSAASQPMARHISQENPMNRSDSADSSALPSSASWATKDAHNESIISSKAPSVSASSPVLSNTNPLPQVEEVPQATSESSIQDSAVEGGSKYSLALSERLFSGRPHPLDRAMKVFLSSTYRFTFDRSMYSEEALRDIDAYPPLFDANGGLVRYRMQQERLKREEEERNASAGDQNENLASGSLQLGGEPEIQDRPNDIVAQSSGDRNTIRLPQSISALSGNTSFGTSSIFSKQTTNLPFHSRSMTPQQQQVLAQRSTNTLQSPLDGQYQQTYSGNTSQHHHQQSNPFQTLNQGFGIPGHGRQASRYTFANEPTSATATINPSINVHSMAQQSAMMPVNQGKIFQNHGTQHSTQHNHFYSGVQGPPPGLKSSGTPPISGGGMFGQGHGFTTPIGANVGLGRGNVGNKNANEELMRELLRGRNGAVNGQGSEAGKRSLSLGRPDDVDVTTMREAIDDIIADTSKTPTTKVDKSHSYNHGAIPPGLSSTQDFPPLAAPQPAVPPPKLQRKGIAVNMASPVVKPVVPVLPIQPSRTNSALKDDHDRRVPLKKTGDLGPSGLALREPSTTKPGAKIKLSKAISDTPVSQRSKPRAKHVSEISTMAGTPHTKTDQKALPEVSQQEVEKRHHPGKLDIAAAKDSSENDIEAVNVALASDNPVDPASAASTLFRPVTPSTGMSQVVALGARQSQPRTMRVLPTPKVETLPQVSPISPSMTSVTATKKPTSRRGSFTSMHLPGTPLSEKISDNASFTSTSMSRANSPPPTKIGSAPVRQVTKSQQKKERQVRAKVAEEAPVKAVAEGSIQAPIVGRKKKTKKSATRDTENSTPAITRPSSPAPKDENSPDLVPSVPVTPLTEIKETVQSQKDKPENEAAATGLPSADHRQNHMLTAASILSSLQKSGEISSTSLDMFKNVVGLNYRSELVQSELLESEVNPTLSAAQARQINEGEAIAFNYAPNKRIIILPDHRILRGLSAEQAQRYLELHKELHSKVNPAVFHPVPQGITERYRNPVPHRIAARQSSGTPSSENIPNLENRFVTPPLTQSVTSIMPTCWPPSLLSDETDGRRTIMEVDEAEQALLASRKETELLEKKLNALMKRNRKLVFGNAG